MQLVLSAPVLYSLELTPLCNNRCPGCFNVFIDDKVTRPMQKVRTPLSAAGWRRILEKLKPHAERIKLTGGEPTLHPEFETIVHALAEFNLSFSLFTNARWRHPDALINLLSSIPQFGGFLISVHGPNAQSHEAYSGVAGSFEETIANIRRAVAAGLHVATSTVISKQNCEHLDETIALSATLGADHAVINRYLGAPLPDIEPSQEQLKYAVQQVDELRRGGARVKFGNCVPQCFVENSSTGCLAGVAYCAVSPWGELRPCNHSYTVAGNLLEQPIESAWRSEKMEAWRNLMPDECQTSCSAFSSCHGACRALIEIRGEARDPLRSAPLPFAVRPAASRVTLYEGLVPLATYHLRQEEFGYVVMRGNRVVPLAPSEYRVLGLCDGSQTLRQIEHALGAPGLKTIVQLYKKGIIDWTEPRKSQVSPISDLISMGD